VKRTPSQVLDMQGHLYSLMQQPRPREYTANVAASLFRNNDMPDRGVGEQVTDHIESLVRGAHTYHVQSEMTQVIRHAALGLDDDMPWRVEFLPTMVGFAYFDDPILVDDVRGRQLKTHAVLWGPAKTDHGPAIATYWFNDMTDPDDSIKEIAAKSGVTVDQVREYYGRVQLFHVDMLLQGVTLGPARLEIPEEKRRQVEASGDTVAPCENSQRVFTAYMRLLGQTLVKSSPAHVDRHAVKRATRKGLPGLVTTVTLRRVQYVGEPAEGVSHVEWQHRWLVRGHWRRQPCGADHPLAEPDGDGGFIAYIFINPYVKGPEDKPLHMSNKVYDLAR
jgi:hypothetical protein